jgi:ABC-type multidrug transport system fused ATPase/permease subunit
MAFIMMVGMIIAIVPPVAGPVFIATVTFFLCSEAVNRSNQEIKRESNTAMGPVQSNISEAAHAKSLARVMQCESFFLHRHHRVVNEFNRANFASFSLLSWMQLSGVYASFIIATFTAVYVVANRDKTNLSRGALALTYSFTVPYYLGMVSMVSSMLKAWITSYERVR